MSNWPYPHIVAHRGGGKLAPENTLAAIDVGARCGHTMVEFDVKLSKDGEIFLLHDDNLERTSNGWGVAGEVNWQDLLRVDAGSWFSGKFKGEPLPLSQPFAPIQRQVSTSCVSCRLSVIFLLASLGVRNGVFRHLSVLIAKC